MTDLQFWRLFIPSALALYGVASVVGLIVDYVRDARQREGER